MGYGLPVEARRTGRLPSRLLALLARALGLWADPAQKANLHKTDLGEAGADPVSNGPVVSTGEDEGRSKDMNEVRR